MPDFLIAELSVLLASSFDQFMRAIWDVALGILRAVFGLVDELSAFTIIGLDGNVDPNSPIAAILPVLRGLSLLIAVALFLWQLTTTMVQGGRGFLRLATGPFAYIVAMASTISVVGVMILAADGLTDLLLQRGLQAANFTDVLSRGSFGDVAVGTFGGVTLGIVAVIGVIPAAVGYLLELVFRQAAIFVLLSTVPITAAGLLARVGAPWFWTSLRWTIAAILIKPTLALLLVVGVAMVGQADGLTGLLGGVGVLLIGLTTPFVLYRLLAFVDPNTNPGAGMRDWAQRTAGGLSGGGGGGSGSSADATTYARFDQAIAGYAGTEMDNTRVGAPGTGSTTTSDRDDDQHDTDRGDDQSGTSSGRGADGTAGGGADGGGTPPPPPDTPQRDPDDDGGPAGGGPRGGGPSGGGPRGGGPGPGGGAGGAGGAEAAAAVVV